MNRVVETVTDRTSQLGQGTSERLVGYMRDDPNCVEYGNAEFDGRCEMVMIKL